MAGSIVRSNMQFDFNFAFNDTTQLPNINGVFPLDHSIQPVSATGGVTKGGAQKLTIAGGGAQNVNLNAGLSIASQTQTITKVKGFIVFLDPSTTSVSVTVTGQSGRPWNTAFGTGGVTINNGGWVYFADPGASGYGLTASTNDSITITNNDGSNTATVYVAAIGE